jgi:hypothetical protein
LVWNNAKGSFTGSDGNRGTPPTKATMLGRPLGQLEDPTTARPKVYPIHNWVVFVIVQMVVGESAFESEFALEAPFFPSFMS